MRDYPSADVDYERRQFMATAARALLGVSFAPLAMSRAATAPSEKSTGKAKSVIYLFMQGAMSQLDTFDPKPDSDVQGETKAIDTNVAGVRVGEHLPSLAKKMDRLTVIRSLTTETGAHGPGQYLMRTSYQPLASTRHPSLGPWIQKLSGKGNPVLPGSVVIGAGSGHPGGGYLSAAYTPVPVGAADRGLANTKPPRYLSEEQFTHRMKLAESFDQSFQKKYRTSEVTAYKDLYQEAIRLMTSEDLLAFDITQEPEKTKELYGASPFGAGCLLARRLVQNGVKFVEVELGGWDFHRDLWEDLPEKAHALDQGLSALLTDLQSTGMLDETLVVVATEFGRTPAINSNAGRDHHPGAFSCLLAGGGVRGGEVYGETDGQARAVSRDPVGPGDLNSTIAYAMGLDPAEEIHSPEGRPFTIGDGGKPLVELFG